MNKFFLKILFILIFTLLSSFVNANELLETPEQKIEMDFNCFKKHVKKDAGQKPQILRNLIDFNGKTLKVTAKNIRNKNWLLSNSNNKIEYIEFAFFSEKATISLIGREDKTLRTYQAIWEITNDNYFLLGIPYTKNITETYALSINLETLRGKIGGYVFDENRENRKCVERGSYGMLSVDIIEYFKVVELSETKTSKKLEIGKKLSSKIKKNEEENKKLSLLKIYEKKSSLFGLRLLDEAKLYSLKNTRKFDKIIFESKGFPVKANEFFLSKYQSDLEFFKSDLLPPIINKSFQNYNVITINNNGRSVISEVWAIATLPFDGIESCKTFQVSIEKALKDKLELVPAEKFDFRVPNKKLIFTGVLETFCGKDGKHYASLDTIEFNNINSFTIILKVEWNEQNIVSFFSIKEKISGNIDTKNF